jgi:hypothetical protein
MKSYEVWIDEDENGTMLSLGTNDQIQEERSKGLLGANPRLLFRIQADTYEEALAVRNVKLGWSPYTPNGGPADCPNGCGGIFYPAGYAECPNCGVILEEQRQQALRKQEAEIEPSTTKAVIKSIDIVDAPGLDPAKYSPSDPDDFNCTFSISIGPAAKNDAAQFYLSVCSAKWVTNWCQQNGFSWGRHRLIVPQYNFQTIVEIINACIEKCSGESWPEVLAQLSRIVPS